jgi:hypothetical protein
MTALLAGSEPSTTDLNAVVMAELKAYGPSRVILDGQPGIISASLAKTLGLVGLNGMAHQCKSRARRVSLL